MASLVSCTDRFNRAFLDDILSGRPSRESGKLVSRRCANDPPDLSGASCNVEGALIVYELVTGTTADPGARVAPVVPTLASSPFEEVYRAQWAPLVRLALALSGSREMAEDIVHDSFLRVSGSLENIANPAAYLRKTVVNAVRDRYRRGQLEARHLVAPLELVPGPEIDETWAALQALPERYRAALVLRFYADLAVEDVALVLGCRTGTAKSLIHRGLRQLKERLEP